VDPSDRCCDVEWQVAVHLNRHQARYKPQLLDSNGNCEPFGSLGSDACSVAALPSSPCRRRLRPGRALPDVI
jgi:hypothetical protein